MNERIKLSLGQIWVLISAFCLLLPVFMPSSADPQHFFENVMGTVTVTLFILSFPMSLFGLPVMLMTGAILGINPTSIEGMYLNLTLMFVFGVVQWFWIVPRWLANEPKFQTLNLFCARPEVLLAEAKIESRVDLYDARGRTPVERVIGSDPENPINPS
jgi:hypothetical protein